MGDSEGDGEALLALIRRSRRKPVSFGFRLSSDRENNVLVAHRRLVPFKLYRLMMVRYDVTAKGSFGRMQMQGSSVIFYCERELPQMKKFLRRLLRAKGWNLKPKIEEAAADDQVPAKSKS